MSLGMADEWLSRAITADVPARPTTPTWPDSGGNNSLANVHRNVVRKARQHSTSCQRNLTKRHITAALGNGIVQLCSPGGANVHPM